MNTTPIVSRAFSDDIQTSPELVVVEVDAVGVAEGGRITTSVRVGKTSGTTVVHTRHWRWLTTRESKEKGEGQWIR